MHCACVHLSFVPRVLAPGFKDSKEAQIAQHTRSAGPLRAGHPAEHPPANPSLPCRGLCLSLPEPLFTGRIASPRDPLSRPILYCAHIPRRSATSLACSPQGSLPHRICRWPAEIKDKRRMPCRFSSQGLMVEQPGAAQSGLKSAETSPKMPETDQNAVKPRLREGSTIAVCLCCVPL